jgi:hypothetical protein
VNYFPEYFLKIEKISHIPLIFVEFLEIPLDGSEIPKILLGLAQ